MTKKNYSEFITEVNRYREQKLNYQYGERNKPENYLPKDPVKDAKKVKLAQIAPMKTTVLGPDLKSLPHIDCRGPGQKLCSVMNQARYSRETGRTPPKIP